MTSSQVAIVHTPTFGQWLSQQFRSRGKLFYLPSFGSLTGLGALIGIPLNWISSPLFRPGLFFLQALLCCILLFLIPTARSSIQISDRATIATKQFLEAWKRLWLFWILLYLTFLAREVGVLFFKVQLQYPDGSLPAWWRYGWVWLLNVMSNLQTLSLFMLYRIVTKSTVNTDQHDSSLPWVKGLAVFAIVTVVDLFAVVGSLVPNDIALIKAASEPARQFFMWAPGFLAGISIALFVGRLDSKYIDPPTWFITLLYLYALIQVPWGAFENKVLETIITSAALLLKSLLFLFVAWMLQTGILFFFVERVAHLISTSRNERDDYLKKLNVIEQPRSGHAG